MNSSPQSRLDESHKALAAAELLRRRRARASLMAFAQAVDIPGAPVADDEDAWLFRPVETGLAAHHRLILGHLQRIADGEIRRLMVFAPPGSAKSSYTSVVFPSWYLGRAAGAKVILASYATDIARRQGRKCRSVVNSGRYAPIFGCTLSKETSAAEAWALTNGSEFMGAGILTGITGNRAHGIIIDDPVAGREEAGSETVRRKTLEAYQDDLRTRLIPGGFEILIQTRWHEDDLAGNILPRGWNGESGPIQCRDGQVWHVICLPAIADRNDDPVGRKIGERLWPEWFPEDHFEVFRAQPRTWSALYQQRPTPPEGALFKRAWLASAIRKERLPTLRTVRAWDLAATLEGQSADPDWTVGVRMSLTADQRYVVEHVERLRGSPADVERTIQRIARQDGPGVTIVLPQDPGQAGKFQVAQYAKALAGFTLQVALPRGSKDMRAGPLATQAEYGNLLLMDGAWVDPFITELCSFPTGKHDDQVDAAADAFRNLASAPQGPIIGRYSLN